MTESHALALLEPSNLQEARDLSRDIVESGLFPKLRSPGGALVFIMTARDLKIPISVALRMVDVIEGKTKDQDTGQWIKLPTVSLKAELQVALVRRDPRCAFFDLEHDPTVPGNDPTFAVWRTAFVGREEDVKRATFTLEDARGMGLIERKAWTSQPTTMLMWRAATRLIKRWWSDVTLGLADPEEVREESITTIEAVTVPSSPAALPASTNAAKLGAILEGEGVLEAARVASPAPKASPQASTTAPQASTRSPEGERLFRELIDLQKDMIARYGEDVAKRAWSSAKGPGAIKGLVLDDDLRGARARATTVLEALDLGDRLNRVRGSLAEWTGTPPVLLEAPEVYAVAALKQMLDSDGKRLRAAKKAGEVKEGEAKAESAPKAEVEGCLTAAAEPVREPGADG